MDRTPYIQETVRTLPLMEGRTIGNIRTVGSFTSGRANEVTGLNIEFTDGTVVSLNAENIAGLGVLDVARSTGL